MYLEQFLNDRYSFSSTEEGGPPIELGEHFDNWHKYLLKHGELPEWFGTIDPPELQQYFQDWAHNMTLAQAEKDKPEDTERANTQEQVEQNRQTGRQQARIRIGHLIGSTAQRLEALREEYKQKRAQRNATKADLLQQVLQNMDVGEYSKLEPAQQKRYLEEALTHATAPDPSVHDQHGDIFENEIHQTLQGNRDGFDINLALKAAERYEAFLRSLGLQVDQNPEIPPTPANNVTEALAQDPDMSLQELKGAFAALAYREVKTERRQEALSTQEQEVEYSPTKIAMLYPQGPKGGGVQSTLRSRGEQLLKKGHSVHYINGTEPVSPEFVVGTEEGQERLQQTMISELSDRHITTLFIAEYLSTPPEARESLEYAGEPVTAERFSQIYEHHKDTIKQKLLTSLGETQVLEVDNLLFPRHPAMAQALIELLYAGQLPASLESIVVVTHDIGLFDDGEQKHYTDYAAAGPTNDDLKTARPQWFTSTRFSGAHGVTMKYVGVSRHVNQELTQMSFYSLDGSQDPLLEEISPSLINGSDYDETKWLKTDMPLGQHMLQLVESLGGWSQVRRLIAMPGRVSQRKGQVHAVESMAFIKDSLLVITGDEKVTTLSSGEKMANDPYYAILRAMVEELELQDNVNFAADTIGRVPDEEYAQTEQFLAIMCDALIAFPEKEGWGLDAAAMLAQTDRLLITDVEAFEENLGDGRSAMPRGSDPLLLAAAMCAIISSKSNTDHRQKVREERTWERNADQLLNIAFG